MEPTMKMPKEKAKKSVFGEGQPAGTAAKSVPAEKYTSSRDEEVLVLSFVCHMLHILVS
jgi:hypothetical protein